MNFLSFIITFLVSIIFAPVVIKLTKKLKLGQNILGYVEEHSAKQGTPTMGGVIFILPSILVSLFFLKSNLTMPILCLAVFLAYGIIGFLDDFIKIKFKRNLGLRPYQKIIFQLLLAIIVAVFVYKNNLIGSSVFIPFTVNKINLGWFIIPFVITVLLATTNSVNLTDGLDGLAGSVSLIFFIAITLVSSFYLNFSTIAMQSEYSVQIQNLINICWCVSGGLLAFLVFNFYPAKIFMGDTGSLSLGGLMGVVCCFSGTSLYIPIIGFMFVVSSLSVIIQVLYFKKTKKRVFLMAPFHHHLQHKGMYETKIVFIYIVITLLLTLMTLMFLGFV
ncbi:MAG: phospho-N-acetylmuramoyl-pentapeptide-transferase [Clostridia bacterium]|nr:phospho-N-acetylmuramoyl-pentapeptide-transferase [Clostridia bacterium]